MDTKVIPYNNCAVVLMGRWVSALFSIKRSFSTGRLTMARIVDMRSDTVTKPTQRMREAMMQADVGDDVYGEDPSVNLLQQTAARMLGKEAALFVPTGTMSNLVSILGHCWQRGDEVFMGDFSHMAIFEQGGVAQLGGVFPRQVKNFPDGTLDLDDLCRKAHPDGRNTHFSISRVICVENSHNFMGGRVITPQYMDDVGVVAKKLGLKIHVDGARLFNAATALGIPAAELVKQADSVNICLSKGLGAPVGSLVVGSSEHIQRAQRLRKVLGGGMRQAGVLAAPGLIALEQMSQRLQDDHDRARQLARGLDQMTELGVKVDLATVETNIVVFHVQRDDLTAPEFCERLATTTSDGDTVVKISPRNATQMRAVTHHHISSEDIDAALTKMQDVLSVK